MKWRLVNAVASVVFAASDGIHIAFADDRSQHVALLEQRQRFQSQELITAKSGGWVFAPLMSPRIIWRDVDEVRRLHGDVDFQVRWFDAELVEFPKPEHPGRWMAWISGTAPNGTAFRRSLTFFALPPDIFSGSVPDMTVAFPKFPGPNALASLLEHKSEFVRLGSDSMTRSLLDSEKGAILIAGVFESKPLGRPARHTESASVVNDDYHLALKLKLLGLKDCVRALQSPRHLEIAVSALHEGSTEQAGVASDAKARIDTLCQAWADDTGEPFVTLIARRGVIVTHRAFGRDGNGNNPPLDYRCWVASLTKTVTSLMFSQFIDQGLIQLDAPISSVFSDFPANDPHVPNFRQCLNHTSGLTGHGDFGGMKNPHLENIILNGIDANEPNARYAYSGMGFELAAKAMEIVSGKSAARIYAEHLFKPLGFGDVAIGNASSDGEFTAMELGILAQLVANHGRYGSNEFISATTFQLLLPQPMQVDDGSQTAEQGLGLHRIQHRRMDGPKNSKSSEELLFGPKTLGHGSFSGCVFVVDPDQNLVITLVRRQTGIRHPDWSTKFFQTIADVISPQKGTTP